ncbi:MAG TPA: Gfo/Idh/MocA family oxidoreductase [Bacteroidales bacterium]|nr:Gfo/Idh/MocA family oxidoreductase [Bacteroidales bacterium]HPT11016.1 Gfo/Idh/MocA family oxidoreductase [Bacteroidales bacterium]
MKNKLLLIGAGNMGKEYSKVLTDMNVAFEVIGRGEATAAEFEKVTGKRPCTGGVEKYLNETSEIPEYAIVAVDVTLLYSTTVLLLERGVRKILVEKPAALFSDEIMNLNAKANACNADVFVAYNRRFYESVRAAQRIIEEDGGVESFQFEFTEWSHRIEKIEKDRIEKERWFLSNSSHVADMAFYLGGKPVSLSAYHSGSLSWHNAASCFTGAGVTENKALFSYSANWAAPGRWGVELLTSTHRLILRPLEKLQIQNKGTIDIEQYNIDETLDTKYKPGLYRMVEAFLGRGNGSLCTVSEQAGIFRYYLEIANYR